MSLSRDVAGGWGRGWVVRTPYNGLYGKAPPEKGTFFSFSYMEGVEISFVKVYKRVAKSVFILFRLLSAKRPKRANRHILCFWFCDLLILKER